LRITDVRTVEDCIDGSSTYSYEFDSEWTSDEIGRLSSLGRLQYFADFPRPFFRVLCSGGGQLKGVEGERTCLAIFLSYRKKEDKTGFESLFGSTSDIR